MPFLSRYADRRVVLPGDGITCPQELVDELQANQLIVDATTVTDGQCGLHAFLISLADARHRWPSLTRTCAWKTLARFRPVQSKLTHLRDIAVRWLQKFSKTTLWEGVTVRQFVASSMSNEVNGFGDYIQKMSQTTYWIDGAVLHALGIIFKVDVMLFQHGSDVAFVGESLGQHEPSRSVPMIPIALVNDRHYWGVLTSHRIADSFVGDAAAHHAERVVPETSHTDAAGADADADADVDDDAQCEPWVAAIVPAMVPDEEVRRELDLCIAICDWNPFNEPHADLLKCIASMNASAVDQPAQCAVRQQAIEDILHEQAHFDELPTRLKYHGACRWRLSQRKLAADSTQRRTLALEYLSTRHCLLPATIASDLEADCSTHSKVRCACLDQFRENNGIVRNWRVLWHSLPMHQRRELILRLFKADFDNRQDPVNEQREWRMQYTFLGVDVCKKGFQILTRIGNSSLTKARTGAKRNNCSSLSRHEMGYDLALRMTNKPQLYLDARRWLENYGSTFAEQSPNSLICTLPPGRKHFYYLAYRHDRESDNRDFASEPVFLMCWRVDVSWLIVAPGNQQQGKCGVCTFFKLQIDSAARGSPSLLILKSRLGKHFQFQAAQRLVQDNVEERAAQSHGDLWMMKIDRMDQTKSILPAMWALLRSPLFKLGERLVTSIVGSRWSGTGTDVHYLLRSNFEDFSHGADTQCSVILENLMYVGAKAGRLPKEFVISADNTVKETKNNCFVHFAVWLLCNLADTCLWSILFCSLITGHTHDSLDRFFSLIRQSLTGHDYFTVDDIWTLVRSALSNGDKIHTAHVCQTWGFTQLGADAGLPRIHGHDLPRIHVFNVFRSTSGIWIKWKQFMTDDVWSRPVLLLGARRMQEVARMRPAKVDARFNRQAEMMSWSRKLEEALSDQLPQKQN